MTDFAFNVFDIEIYYSPKTEKSIGEFIRNKNGLFDNYRYNKCSIISCVGGIEAESYLYFLDKDMGKIGDRENLYSL